MTHAGLNPVARILHYARYYVRRQRMLQGEQRQEAHV
jgi:hypothetical protein